jgi:SAM-dependent methyltransferase
LAREGAQPVALDLSAGMLRHAEALGRATGVVVPLVQADAMQLPFRDGSFDVACSAFGAVPFVADPDQVMREVARVLRPGGRWVFAVNHPMRWMFSDDPGEDGLVVRQSYFDRMPYVEVDGQGAATYVEHHRTLGDRVRDVVAAGLRGELFPGTAIFCCRKS